MKKIAIYGITANPPHIGHVSAILGLIDKVDQVWVSLVVNHPFNKKEMLSYEHRLAMLKLMIKEINNNKIVLMELDKKYLNNVKEYNVVYSYNLLHYLKNLYKDYNFSLAIGEDNKKKETWEKFYNYQKIEQEFEIIVSNETIQLHSTDLRNEKNINKWNNKTYPSIIEYIVNNNLYKVTNE